MEDSSYSIYSIGERDIYFCGDISPVSIAIACSKLIEVQKNIIQLNEIYKNNEIGYINLFLTTYGGEAQTAFALIDLILTSPIPIFTYCLGEVYSAGVGIFLAGARRFMTRNSQLMYHNSYYPIIKGNKNELNDRIEELERIDNKIDKLILTRTKLSEKRLKEIKAMNKDYYFSADEALKLNFATDIFECPDWGYITR